MVPGTVREYGVRMRALWHGLVLADSDSTREADGYVYFPRDAVRMDLLQAVARTAADRRCPHGVQFYDVVEGGRRAPRCAWSYESPGPALRHVAQWIGFQDEVEVGA